MTTKLTVAAVALVAFAACNSSSKGWHDAAVDNARVQIGMQIDTVESFKGAFHNPTTLNPDGSVLYCYVTNCRTGFFPANESYLYEITGYSS